MTGPSGVFFMAPTRQTETVEGARGGPHWTLSTRARGARGGGDAAAETSWTPGSRTMWLSLVIGISTNSRLPLMTWTKNVASCEKGLTDGCISRNTDANGRATTRGIA